MQIAIASDHAGYQLKELIINSPIKEKISFIDLGPYQNSSVDYPDFVDPLCQKVLKKECLFGILICHTGIGMSITANKYHGIRAALIDNITDAKLTRQHNNANVLCLAGRKLNVEHALLIIETFIMTEFEGGRHQNRIDKITLIEKKF